MLEFKAYILSLVLHASVHVRDDKIWLENDQKRKRKKGNKQGTVLQTKIVFTIKL